MQEEILDRRGFIARTDHFKAAVVHNNLSQKMARPINTEPDPRLSQVRSSRELLMATHWIEVAVCTLKRPVALCARLSAPQFQTFENEKVPVRPFALKLEQDPRERRHPKMLNFMESM